MLTGKITEYSITILKKLDKNIMCENHFFWYMWGVIYFDEFRVSVGAYFPFSICCANAIWQVWGLKGRQKYYICRGNQAWNPPFLQGFLR